MRRALSASPPEGSPLFHWRPSTMRTFFAPALVTIQLPTMGRKRVGSAPALSLVTSIFTDLVWASSKTLAQRAQTTEAIVVIRFTHQLLFRKCTHAERQIASGQNA